LHSWALPTFRSQLYGQNRLIVTYNEIAARRIREMAIHLKAVCPFPVSGRAWAPMTFIDFRCAQSPLFRVVPMI
jgi:hypothetical protein